jgi:glyoxylase-like metal-dependent hydrolase (beta-lactamase superfamily II)
MIRPVDLHPGVQSFAVRTPTLPPATHTNSYALGERDILLVEPSTPFEDEQRAFVDWAEGLRSIGRNPIALFLTHHHADHAAGASTLARALELPIWAHAATAARLSELRVDRILADGETIHLDGQRPQQWSVLHTPGHAPGHLCLFEASLRYLVAGDMVATEGTILVETTDGDMQLYLEQLERLRALDSVRALPAHGIPIETPDALFERYLRHRRMREARILRVVEEFGEEGGSLEALTPRAYDDVPEAALGLARLSVEAHLVKLVREGRVRSDGERVRAAGGEARPLS